ncbi:MAG TPA: hypothetical protein VIJ25_08645 [Methylococcales bacterium]
MSLVLLIEWVLKRLARLQGGSSIKAILALTFTVLICTVTSCNAPAPKPVAPKRGAVRILVKNTQINEINREWTD